MTYRIWKSRASVDDANAGKKMDSSGIYVQLGVEQNEGQAPPTSNVASKELHGRSLGSRGKPSKLMKMAPTKYMTRLCDAYVAFMLSIAGKANANMGAIAYSQWPSAAVPSRFPGRGRRFEKSDEDHACSGVVLASPASPRGMGFGRSPACPRKAVFPL